MPFPSLVVKQSMSPKNLKRFNLVISAIINLFVLDFVLLVLDGLLHKWRSSDQSSSVKEDAEHPVSNFP